MWPRTVHSFETCFSSKLQYLQGYLEGKENKGLTEIVSFRSCFIFGLDRFILSEVCDFFDIQNFFQIRRKILVQIERGALILEKLHRAKIANRTFASETDRQLRIQTNEQLPSRGNINM